MNSVNDRQRRLGGASRCAPSGERGASLVEVLVVLAITGMLAMIGISGSINALRLEKAREAVHLVRSALANARIEALKRNRATRFAIDTSSGTYQVIDTLGTSSSSDDVVISSNVLDSNVFAAMPDGSTAVTLQSAGGTVYYAQFEQSGTVTGAGQVALHCDEAYTRVTLASGGGLAVQRWSGSTWKTE